MIFSSLVNVYKLTILSHHLAHGSIDRRPSLHVAYSFNYVYFKHCNITLSVSKLFIRICETMQGMNWVGTVHFFKPTHKLLIHID